MSTRQQRRRFYREVKVTAEETGFGVRLDGRPLRTPAGQPLVVPTAALAGTIAAEWQAQQPVIDAATMPLTRLVFTALDRIAPQRAGVVDELLNYAQTDLVCYRAEGPGDLVQEQDRTWQPLVDWVAERWQAPLDLAVGVIPIAQPPATIAALRAAVVARDDLGLTALAGIVQASGSLVIGLALVDGALDAETACRAALLDEEYQAERWGRDEPAERRRARIREEIGIARRLIDLVAVAQDG
jgi:chaperone required for assembly of F1-ATPase